MMRVSEPLVDVEPQYGQVIQSQEEMLEMVCQGSFDKLQFKNLDEEAGEKAVMTRRTVIFLYFTPPAASKFPATLSWALAQLLATPFFFADV